LQPAPVAPAFAVNYHVVTVATQGVIMSENDKARADDNLRAAVEMRGLGRAFALFPDIVATAFERGRRPIGSFPENFSPLTEPAARFVPVPEEFE
jgi:hypothetical protein